MNEELKPVKCGCGGSPIVRNDRGKAVYVQCVACGTRSIETNYKEAVEAWNTAMGERVVKVRSHGVGTAWSVCECGQGVNLGWSYCPFCGGRIERK